MSRNLRIFSCWCSLWTSPSSCWTNAPPSTRFRPSSKPNHTGDRVSKINHTEPARDTMMIPCTYKALSVRCYFVVGCPNVLFIFLIYLLQRPPWCKLQHRHPGRTQGACGTWEIPTGPYLAPLHKRIEMPYMSLVYSYWYITYLCAL